MEMHPHLAPSPLPDTGGPRLPGPGCSPTALASLSGLLRSLRSRGPHWSWQAHCSLDGSSGPRPGLRPCLEAA